MKQKLFLTFPQEILEEPLLYTLGRDYHIIPNIQGASVTAEKGMMAVMLEGEEDEVERAISWLEGRGVLIERLDESAETPDL